VTAERQIFFANVEQSEVAAILIAGQRLPMAAAACGHPRNPAFEHGQDNSEDNRDVHAIDQELWIRQKLWDVRSR